MSHQATDQLQDHSDVNSHPTIRIAGISVLEFALASAQLEGSKATTANRRDQCLVDH